METFPDFPVLLVLVRGQRRTGTWNKHPGDDAEGAGICYSKCAHTGQTLILMCPVAKKMSPWDGVTVMGWEWLY